MGSLRKLLRVYTPIQENEEWKKETAIFQSC